MCTCSLFSFLSAALLFCYIYFITIIINNYYYYFFYHLRNPWAGTSYQQMVTSNYYEPELSSHSSETGSRIYHVIDGPGPPGNYCSGGGANGGGETLQRSKIRTNPIPVQNHHPISHPHGVSTMKKLPPIDQLPRVQHLQSLPSHEPIPIQIRGPPQPPSGQFYSRNFVTDVYPQRPHFRPSSQADFLEEIRPAQPQFYSVGSGRTSRATLDVPLSSTTSDDDGGGIDACGGHCVAFENFCHYCLQVIIDTLALYFFYESPAC